MNPYKIKELAEQLRKIGFEARNQVDVLARTNELSDMLIEKANVILEGQKEWRDMYDN